MVSFQNLRDADPGAYDDIADRWSRLGTQLEATGDDVKSTAGRLDGWSGEAADAAREHFADIRSEYDTAAEYIGTIPSVLRELSDAITAAQETVNGVVETVDSNNNLFLDRDTGEVEARGPSPGDHRSEEERKQDLEAAEELNGTVREALEEVREADRVAASALAEASPDAAGLELEATGAGNTVSPADLPGADASAQDVTEWWDGLTPMQQESAITTHGDAIGSMDGIPAEARDRANRVGFAEEYAELDSEHGKLEELEALGDDRNHLQEQEYTQLSDAKRGMDAIHNRIDREPGAGTPPSYLLDYSTEGNGRGIVATGNPDTADNVVTSVPGMDSSLATMGTELERDDQILAEADRQSRDDETAAISWVGYDAPQGLGQAINADYAEDAAGDLRDFQDGLRATHEGAESNNTVIGHSYGSTATGYAAQGENVQLDADNIAFVGSPGVGVDQASELQVPEDTDIYASTAQHDIITPASPHGVDPTSEYFDAETFASDPGSKGSWYTGGYSSDAHSEYWNEDSDSLENMGRIVTGQQPR